jgi:aryl-alcohol dehydrogenase-like predicted oxidoreductase
LKINRLGFGAMRLPKRTFDGPPREPETGRAILRRVVEMGVNHIDTAYFYRAGSVAANDLIRETLSPYAEDLVIATKVGPFLDERGQLSDRSATPEELRGLVEQDLTSLGLDRLDLVYLRVGLRNPPAEGTIGRHFEVLARMREEGLIRHLGVSHITVNQLEEARSIAPVAAVQNHYHVSFRDDADMLAHCEEAGIAFAPYFPLGGGLTPVETEHVEAVAKRHAATPAQIALAWLLAQSPAMLLIPGTGSLAHLEENMGAGRINLTEEDLAELAG